LRKDLVTKLKRYGLKRKFEKQIVYLKENPKHPSLNLELLEPKSRRIYSIRIDRQFRALLKFLPDKETIEIILITNHYH
jgi:plasmid maintenance system killer protein